MNHTTSMTQSQLRRWVRPSVDLWSLGVTGALVAWASIAEPANRPQIRPREWGFFPSVRNRHLDRVSPVETFLRPVLDRLLNMDPNARSMDVWVAETLFDDMKKRACAQ